MRPMQRSRAEAPAPIRALFAILFAISVVLSVASLEGLGAVAGTTQPDGRTPAPSLAAGPVIGSQR